MTEKLLVKPIKEMKENPYMDEVYFSLTTPTKISNLKLHIQIQGSNREEDIVKVCSHTYYKHIPTNYGYNKESYISPTSDETMTEVCVNLRYRKEFTNEYATDGIFIWLTY
jgi:hypothetical protein